MRGGDTTNDIKRDAARGASVLVQIELALAKRVICLVTIIADSAQYQAIDTILSRDMRNCRALHLDAIGVRRLDSVVAHGVTRNKAVTCGDRADQELLGALVRSDCIFRSINKSMLSKHVGGNITSAGVETNSSSPGADSAISAVSVSR